MSRGFLAELEFKISLSMSIRGYSLVGRKPGLVIVDVVRGFCEPGCGPLAPPSCDIEIDDVVEYTHRIARAFENRDWPILVLADCHDPEVPEPPYDPHCLKGSGHEELMPEIKFLEESPVAEILRKDCINGFVAGITGDHAGNTVLRWLSRKGIDTLVVVGICTDICVLDFVVTILSVRNHRIFGSIPLASNLKDVVVYIPGVATYDLPRHVAEKLDPPAPPHPRRLMHHMGLKIMADRGAILADNLVFC